MVHVSKLSHRIHVILQLLLPEPQLIIINVFNNYAGSGFLMKQLDKIYLMQIIKICIHIYLDGITSDQIGTGYGCDICSLDIFNSQCDIKYSLCKCVNVWYCTCL